jgi:diguanylate cyclase (GGDEF)-like protein/PAS domain S-box-containing protein
MPERSTSVSGLVSVPMLAEREAQIVGIKDFSTPTLEAVDRRRSQLWTMTFAGLVCLAVAVAILSSRRAHHLGFANGTGFRIGTVLLVVGLGFYVVEKERHLRHLARLLTDERVLGAALSNRLKELAVLYEAGKAMNSVLAVDEVLQIILSSAFELLEAASGSIILTDEDGALHLVAQAGSSAATPFDDNGGIARRVVDEGEPLLVKGTVSDDDRSDAETALSVPLLHRDQVLGVLSLIGTQDHVYSEYDLRAVSLFAEHAAISVANARLYEAEKALSARLETKVELGTAELRAREARFAALVQHSSDLVIIIDRDANIVFLSPSVTRTLGWDTEGTLGTSLVAAVHRSDQQRWRTIVDFLTEDSSGDTIVEWRVRHADGSWRFLQSIVTNLIDEPSVGGLVLNSRDITDQKTLEDQLRHQAFHDPLTGLANRALFAEQLDQALRRRSRIGGGLALLFLDLDRFKAVNDLHGHALGDEVLKQTAQRLRATLRDADSIARLGGDEFAVLFEGVAFASFPRSAVERLIESFDQPFLVDSAEIFVTASLGVAIDEFGNESAQDLLRNADLAMYAAKTRSNGGYQVFSPDMHSTILDRMQIESDLRRAAECGEFHTQYQPIVDLSSGTIDSVEALIRWNHPQRGLVMPAEFIYVAESSEMIVQIGQWMLNNACQEFAAAIRQVEGAEGIGLSVNLSARQLTDPVLVDTVQNAAASAGLSLERLTLEITEGAIMEDVANTVFVLEQLRSIGVKIAIDDFGTGYSSLSLLTEIPVDTLKIDRAFVHNVADPRDPTRLIRSILRLAGDFGLGTVAEGVESPDQLQLLQELGCQACQGFYLARPLSAEELVELLQRGSYLLTGAEARRSSI